MCGEVKLALNEEGDGEIGEEFVRANGIGFVEVEDVETEEDEE